MIEVAILTTTRNEEQNIENCILNVKNQRGVRTKHYIVDDGSSDATVSIISYYVALFENEVNHSVVLISNGNHGRANALNLGISYITERYVAILDADDAWHFDKIQIQLKLMKQFHLHVLGTSVDFNIRNYNFEFLEFSVNQLPVKRLKNIGNNILRSNPIAHSSVLLDFQELNGALCYPNRRTQVDYGLWLKLYFLGFKLGNFGEKLCSRRTGAGQSFEAAKHFVYALNSVKLQWKYIFIYKKYRYLYYSLPRLLWALLPQGIRISYRNLWK